MNVTKFMGWMLALIVSTSAWASPPRVAARAWAVVDQASGQTLASHQADLPLAPASLTQLMTAYVLLDDIRRGDLRLDDKMQVPDGATRMDGARIFLQAGEQVTVDTLLRAMLLHSASDATFTLVTARAGSEQKFVDRMNREAQRLGMRKTRFVNATGLPDPSHVSSAHDLALLARALLREFPTQQALFAQKEMAVKGLTYYNANRLLWRDPTVTGLKAGRTPQAGYCLVASAQRGNQTRVAVVLGLRSDAQRTEDALRLLNYSFEQFDSLPLYRAQQTVKAVKLYRGERDAVNLGFLQDFHLVTPRSAGARVKAQVVTRQPVVAPVRKGQRLGTLRLTLDGQTLGDYPLVALQDVGVAGILGRGWDSIRLLFAR